MDQLIPVVGTTAVLGSALMGRIFFAFSSFVMKALAGVPSAEGIGTRGALLPRGHLPRHRARERSLERPVGRCICHRPRRP